MDGIHMTLEGLNGIQVGTGSTGSVSPPVGYRTGSTGSVSPPAAPGPPLLKPQRPNGTAGAAAHRKHLPAIPFSAKGRPDSLAVRPAGHDYEELPARYD